MKLLVVANPISGRGRARRRAEQLARHLQRRGHSVELHFTTGPGDARRRLAALGRSGVPDRIVIVGGDGTLNEAVNGLPDARAVPLAQLAVGTANMLARDLRLPRRPPAVAELLERGAPRRIDLGRANGRRFLMNVSCGFDAMVTERIRAQRSGALGFHAYALPILRTMRGYREPRLLVRLDGGEPTPAALVLVSNLRNYGGLFVAADRARCDSGHLDVLLCRRARRRDLVRYLGAALFRRLSSLKGVDYRSARRVTVTAPEPVAVQIDGDHAGTTPLDVAVEPAAVSILAPSPKR